MFRADSKYKGDPALLLSEIEKKWVRNQKGREQLSAAVRLLFDDRKPETVFQQDRLDEDQVCPLVLGNA